MTTNDLSKRSLDRMVVTVRYDHLHTVDFGDDLQCNRAAKPNQLRVMVSAEKTKKAMDRYQGTPHKDGRQTCSRNSAPFPPRSWLRLS
jgi:hypothetical protein